MPALLAVELRRLLARRLLRVLALVGALLVALTSVLVFANSEKAAPPAAQLDRAVEERAGEVRECARFAEGLAELPEERRRAACEDRVPPPSSFVDDPRFHLTDLGPGGEDEEAGILGIEGVFLLFAAVVLGSSSIGAEWRHGTMTTLLTWEPRRVRVMLAKAAAAAAVAAGLTVALQGLLTLALLPAALARGTTAGADAEFWRATAALVARCAALSAIAAVVGLGIAGVGRNTSAALGAFFFYFVVAEPALRALEPGWQRWLVAENVGTVLTGARLRTVGVGRTPLAAGLLLVAYAAIVLLVATVVFRRRDVT